MQRELERDASDSRVKALQVQLAELRAKEIEFERTLSASVTKTRMSDQHQQDRENELNARLVVLEGKNAEGLQNIAEERARSASLTLTIRALETGKNAKDAELIELLQTAEDAEAQHAALAQMHEEVEEGLRSALTEGTSLRKQLDALSQAKSLLENRLREESARASALVVQRTESTRVQAEQASALHEASKNATEMEQAIADLEYQLQQECENSTDAAMQQAKIERLELLLLNAEGAATELEKELTKSREEFEQSQESYSSLQATAAASEADCQLLRAQVANQKERNSKDADMISQQKAGLANAEREKDLGAREAEAQSSLIGELKSSSSQQAQQLEALRVEAISSLAAIARGEAALVGLQTERMGLLEDVRRAEGQCLQLRDQITAAADKSAGLERRLLSLDQDQASSLHRAALLERESSSLSQSLQTATNQIREMLTKDEVAATIERLKAEWAREKEGLLQKHQQLLSQQESEGAIVAKGRATLKDALRALSYAEPLPEGKSSNSSSPFSSSPSASYPASASTATSSASLLLGDILRVGSASDVLLESASQLSALASERYQLVAQLLDAAAPAEGPLTTTTMTTTTTTTITAAEIGGSMLSLPRQLSDLRARLENTHGQLAQKALALGVSIRAQIELNEKTALSAEERRCAWVSEKEGILHRQKEDKETQSRQVSLLQDQASANILEQQRLLEELQGNTLVLRARQDDLAKSAKEKQRLVDQVERLAQQQQHQQQEAEANDDQHRELLDASAARESSLRSHVAALKSELDRYLDQAAALTSRVSILEQEVEKQTRAVEASQSTVERCELKAAKEARRRMDLERDLRRMDEGEGGRGVSAALASSFSMSSSLPSGSAAAPLLASSRPLLASSSFSSSLPSSSSTSVGAKERSLSDYATAAASSASSSTPSLRTSQQRNHSASSLNFSSSSSSSIASSGGREQLEEDERERERDRARSIRSDLRASLSIGVADRSATLVGKNISTSQALSSDDDRRDRGGGGGRKTTRHPTQTDRHPRIYV